MKVTQCETCGYHGNAAETHALFAVLDGARIHAMQIVEDWGRRERQETARALTDLLAMVTA
jgi:hypothetical protein